MNTYQIEIKELKSGKTVKMPVPGCGWTEHSHIAYETTMCDCNLAGYFHNEVRMDKGEHRTIAHNLVAGNWLDKNKCDHSMPPTRFKAVAAHLDKGGVVAL
jgi:hypothetical protein